MEPDGRCSDLRKAAAVAFPVLEPQLVQLDEKVARSQNIHLYFIGSRSLPIAACTQRGNHSLG